MSEDTISDDFMKAIENFHNPETLFKHAKTQFEKDVAIEFFFQTKRLEVIDNEIKWLKWLVRGVFGVTLLALLINLMDVIPKFIPIG